MACIAPDTTICMTSSGLTAVTAVGVITPIVQMRRLSLAMVKVTQLGTGNARIQTQDSDSKSGTFCKIPDCLYYSHTWPERS